MAPRNRPQRSRNPLLVAAAAVSRAIDPKQPTRIVVIRLLGDALHALQESQLQVDAVRARALAYTARSSTAAAALATRAQLDADNRLKAAHEHGARALFATTISALIKLPCRAGPLRRRAIDLLRVAGRAAGPAIVMQGADTLRAHIASLKRLSWTDTEVGDFEVVCAILTLADVSSCAIAGREVARESILFLLSQRVRQKCKRGDLCYAIAQIVQSFPPHAPPDDRLVDAMLECCLTSPVVKQGSAGQGSALLTALIVPHMVSRGPLPSDDIVTTCARAMRSAPTSPEKAMWALAVARASLTARRSTTFQVRKYGTTDGSKFPQKRAPVTGGAQRFNADPDDTNPSVWLSDQIFEQTVLQVAKVTGLFDGCLDSTVAIAAVCRMWSNILPDSIPVIVPRTFDMLLPHVVSVPAASALLDGLWLGLLKNLKPSLSALVFENVLPALESTELSLTVALHVCSILLAKFGRECLRESGLSVDYNDLTTQLMNVTHTALQTNFGPVRLAGVRMMLSVIHALPRTCSQFLTAILQNLRISDLALATTPAPSGGLLSFEDLSSIGAELSSILGNAAALSVLIAQVSSGQRRVPAALVRQCAIDSIALLRPHHASQKVNEHGPIVACIRRRAGWGLIAALASAKRKDLFEEDGLIELISHWKEELGYAAQRQPKGGNAGASNNLMSPIPAEGTGEQPQIGLDESLAQASTRSSALHALLCSLRNFPSLQLEKCAKALIGACAARIVNLQATLGGSQLGSFGGSSVGMDIPKTDTAQGSNGKKRNSSHLARLLISESSQLLQCVSIVPPTGASAELCYYIAMHLGEEAQHTLGEVDANQAIASSLPYNSSVAEKSLVSDSTMCNHRLSLNRLRECVSDDSSSFIEKLPSVHIGENKEMEKEQRDLLRDVDRSWIFSTEGTEVALAENSLAYAAQAIAAVVAQDLITSGSLIESLSAAKCSSPLSAAIALELARRLSRSDLAEINRTLAMLQVLVRLSLGIPEGCLKALSAQNKSGRLYSPNSLGDGISLVHGEVPGSALSRMATPQRWSNWSRKLSDEGNLDNTMIHNFHSRAMCLMYATRRVAAEAHKELSKTGGPILWMGLTRKVISIVRENFDSSSPSQSITVANAIASLGALLEATPNSDDDIIGKPDSSLNGVGDSSAVELDELFDEVIDVLADAIEKGKANVRTAAALALSNCSSRIATRSDKLLAALVRAWAQDKGDFNSLGHFGRLTTETGIWATCFANTWNDIGIKSNGERKLFFCQDSCGIGSNSPALAIGAAAVLSSCRLQWWELNDSAAFSATELLTEVIQWTGASALNARAAGLYGISTLWASKIDLARANILSQDNGLLTTANGTTSRISAEQYKDGVVPIQSFSLKEAIRIHSAVGPFLDEVVYDSLAPIEVTMDFEELKVAAIAAVLEVLRGAGTAETCTHLPKLPEVLLAAADSGITEASTLLHILLPYDVTKRPKYWFGLCRAVCLGGERLNYGSSKATWDVSLATKGLALKVAVESVDRSLDSCSCLPSVGQGVSQECAMDFLPKIVDFIQQLFQTDKHGVETSGEACKFFQRISARISCPETNWKSNEKAMEAFTNLWSPNARQISRLVSDEVPHSVANMATMAMTEMLVASLRLRTEALIEQSEDALLSFLSKGTPGDLRKRFLYSDQGEEVGLHATLALVSSYGRLISSFLVSSDYRIHCGQPQSALWMKCLEKVGTIKGLLFAVCGDFVSTLRVNELKMIARDGGSLTAASVPESQLEAAISLYITPVVLGALSCIGSTSTYPTSQDLNRWLNVLSPGIRMAQNCSQYESVVLASYVWLMKHEHEDAASEFRKQAFMTQNQEALTCFLNSGKEIDNQIREVLVAFAQCKKSEFLLYSYRLSCLQNFDMSIGICVLELILSILMVGVVDSFRSLQGNMKSIGVGLKGLSKLVDHLGRSRRDLLKPYLAHCMDAVFLVVEQKGSRISSLACDTSFQQCVCSLVKTAILSPGADTDFIKLCFAKTQRIFNDAAMEQCMSVIKLCTSIGATLATIAPEICSKPYADMLVSRKIRTDDDVEDVAALVLCLSCYGVEDYVTNTICELSIDVGEECHAAAKVLAHELAHIGASKHGEKCAHFGLKCAIAAISDDGENCTVTNRLGLVLYSLFLPLLVGTLPDVDSSEKIPLSSLDENGKYMAGLAKEEMLLLGSFAASLQKNERLKVERFLVGLDNATESNVE